ncbi:hypothetical protein COU87_01670 [Candidatus Roizmanbacteria bacterium CG10_big_fil_rev_8_21_14_0_10_39_12]|uniref:Clp R domain-containing protein n=1 Tax=Candidatus Roizmanbacteria bacterium CG10_big_fil_rev_8_21_14_0_10_39_12 TaxID=1974852 RepID=A0A2M8KPZ8_9BACT|nr:MAG: hypothetical protein COU87_01670 [Candidatus Roizmanbacteria bacterium CG10_big_fil_rev_8_21_14_0_10_39_12]
MAGIFDFIKKQAPNANPSNDSGQSDPSNGAVDPSVSPTQSPIDNPTITMTSPVVIKQEPVQIAGTTSQSYNGIGNPPSGQSYNGIGSPPRVKPPMSVAQSVNSPPRQFNGNNPSQKNLSNQPNSNNSYNKNQSQNRQNQSGSSYYSNRNPQQNNQPKGVSLQSNMTDTKRGQLDVMTHLTQRSNKVFMSANDKAKEKKNAFVDSEHLLYGLLSDSQVYKLLTELKVQPQIVEQELAKVYKKENSPRPPQIAPRIKQIIDKSLVVARKLGYEFISPEHILLALYEEGEGVGARILVKLGLTKEDINQKITGKKEGVMEDAEKKDKPKERSALSKYTIDLTAKASRGELDPVVERSDVIERLVHILSRRIKNNPALIGEPGVGKTAIVEGLAQRIVEQRVPESLLNKKILQLDLSSVVAGASHRGEFEERMKAVVDELKASKGEVIMFIDEMHTMMGAGSGEGAIDASNFIKPALARGEVQFIGATTITEYRKYIEKDAALERRFQTIVVPEPNEEASIKMLKASRDKYESFHKVKIPDDVIDACVRLSKRYIGDRFLPDKAFDLMDEAAAAVRLPLISLPEEIKSLEDRISQQNQELVEDEKRGEKVRARILRSKISEVQANLSEKKDEYNMKKAQTTTQVTLNIVKDLIATRTGIPISKIGTSEGDKLTSLEDIIHKRMIGQDRAVTSVAQAIRRGRAGLKNAKRPIGSFVFLGPTGVGKTELAKSLSEVLFDDEEAIVRFDMTEYMERHEVAKLLGPPPGYVGYEEGGKLTEAVRRKPYSLVLFDEIEKAHPDIFNILLQVLDDGRLTDNKGRTISFKNTVVICTSNIGTALIQQDLLTTGKSEVSEPKVISTYAFSPRGRELMTIGNRYFERGGATPQLLSDSQPKADEPLAQATQPLSTTAVQQSVDVQPKKSNTNASWEDHVLTDYFAGQKIEGIAIKGQSTDTSDEQKNPDGLEEKELTELDKNPQEKKPETGEVAQTMSFPTFGYDTHAISAKGTEVITKGSTMYIRASTTAKEWKRTNLIEYFKDNIVINAIPDAPDEQLPTIRFKTHAYSPEEMEIVTFKDRFWRRKEGTTDWQTGMLKDYFTDFTVKQSEGKEISFPVTHWDIHTFTPAGKELILVGDAVWSRENESTQWSKQSIKQYFGENFPLDKKTEEIDKVEEQADKKQYDVIKEKVMNELLKFFRPELVNRFDEVIVFEPLRYKSMMAIAKLQLKSLSKLLEEQEMGFTATDEAIKEIVQEGFDPVYGARPLRRAIQKLVENPISEMIIAQKVKAGDTIIVDYDGIEFIFNVEQIEKKTPDESKKSGEKHTFLCNSCKAVFESELVPNSTQVCAKCASKDVGEKQKTSPSSNASISEQTKTVAANGVSNESTNGAGSYQNRSVTDGSQNSSSQMNFAPQQTSA